MHFPEDGLPLRPYEGTQPSLSKRRLVYLGVTRRFPVVPAVTGLYGHRQREEDRQGK